MENSINGLGPLAASSKHFARRLLTIGENRLELLMVEVQEERERLLRAILLALGVAVVWSARRQSRSPPRSWSCSGTSRPWRCFSR